MTCSASRAVPGCFETVDWRHGRRNRSRKGAGTVLSATSARRVVPAESVPAVRDRESSIPSDRCLDPVALALRGVPEIGDHVVRRVVLRIQQRPMALPDALDPRRLRDSVVMHGQRLLQARRSAAQALPGAVVHDDDLRPDGAEKGWRSGAAASVRDCTGIQTTQDEIPALRRPSGTGRT